MTDFVRAMRLPFTPATNRAAALLANLIRFGVRDVVVCPGSRSQALALAAAAAEKAGAIRLHVRVDERSAAFFALGIARETGMPAPVIVTSGSAVANLLPAVWEAHEARVPMLLLTADRPVELHGRRANQTTSLQGKAAADETRMLLNFAPLSHSERDSAAAENYLALFDAFTPEVAAVALSFALAVPAELLENPANYVEASANAEHPAKQREREDAADTNSAAVPSLAALLGTTQREDAEASAIIPEWQFAPDADPDAETEERAQEFAAAAPQQGISIESFRQKISDSSAFGLFVQDFSHPTAMAWMLQKQYIPGPVQLNIPFAEPLSGTAGADAELAELFAQAAAARDAETATASAAAAAAKLALPPFTYAQATDPHVLVPSAGDIVIAGADAGAAAEEFAHASGLPLLAEVVSGARFGRQAITCYADLLAGELGERVRRAFVFGRPTLTREVWRTLAGPRVHTYLLVTENENSTHSSMREIFRPGEVTPLTRVPLPAGYKPAQVREWLLEWVHADRELAAARTTVHEPDYQAALQTGYKERSAYAMQELAAKREPVTRAMLAESVWRATWPHDRLVLGASRLVRELDRVAPPRPVQVHANRGLAGIDGTLATALGVAVASQGADDLRAAAGVTRVLLGDLAALHDANSLLQQPGETRPRIQVFVGNDGGGRIFDTLEVRESADPELFARVITTPQQIDFAKLAEAYGWDYVRVTNRGELDAVLTAQVTGPQLVEVPL